MRFFLMVVMVIIVTCGLPFADIIAQGAALAVADETTHRFFPYDYENYTLDNGFKSVLIPMEGSGLVAYYTVVRTGSRDEWEPGKSGFAHFFEHMMFGGTEKYSSAEYSRIVSPVARLC